MHSIGKHKKKTSKNKRTRQRNSVEKGMQYQSMLFNVLSTMFGAGSDSMNFFFFNCEKGMCNEVKIDKLHGQMDTEMFETVKCSCISFLITENFITTNSNLPKRLYTSTLSDAQGTSYHRNCNEDHFFILFIFRRTHKFATTIPSTAAKIDGKKMENSFFERRSLSLCWSSSTFITNNFLREFFLSILLPFFLFILILLNGHEQIQREQKEGRKNY